MKSRLLFFVLTLFLAVNLSAQENQSFSLNNITKNFDKLGLSFEVAYTSEVFSNLSGGYSQKTCYIDNFDFLMNFDLNKSIGINNSQFVFYVLGNNGNIPSDHIGAIQGVSNIETTPTWKLYQAYYTQSLFNEKLSYVLGIYDLNSEFDVRETSSLFINPAHGIGTDYAQSGCNGPSIFPNAGLALSFNFKFTDNILFRTGIFEGIPADPNNPIGTHLKIQKDEGVLIASEMNLEFGNFEELDENFARYAIGGWYFSTEFEDIISLDKYGNPLTHKGTYGIYAFAEKYILNTGANSRIAGFLRVGMADDKVNMVDYYIGGGIVYYGLFNESDQFGIAVASAHNNDRCRYTTNLDSNETNIELTYHTQIFEWLSVQPDIQYIINPSAEHNISNSLVVGTRLQLTLN